MSLEREIGLLLFLGLWATVLVGCEEDLAGRDDLPMPYSMYGVLSPQFKVQSIRVYMLEAKPTLGSQGPLEADVTSTDLQTGERHVWRDSVMVDPNGQHEHVFWAPFRAEYGHAYRVEVVRRSDGATSWAEVRIPNPPALSVEVFDVPIMHLLVETDDARVLKPEARYTVNTEIDGEIQPLHTIPISYEGQEKRVENGWRVTFNIDLDVDEIVNEYAARIDVPIPGPPYLCGAGLVLRRLELSVIVGDVAWDPPGGFLDPLILSQPKTMSNVENGFGFIGGGFRISAPAFPPARAVNSTCLTYGL